MPARAVPPWIRDDIRTGSSGPIIRSVYPADNAVGIDPETAITVTFLRVMDSSTITVSTFTLVDTLGNPVTGTIIANGKEATFTPWTDLSMIGDYTVRLTTGVKDLMGYPVAADYSWGFRARDGSWGTAELVETDDAGHALDPQIAIDQAGNAIAVWKQITAGMNSVFANRYVSGTGWGIPELLEIDDAGNALDPQIAFDAQCNAIAVWGQDTGTGFYSLFANRYIPGTGWGIPELLETNDAGEVGGPQIAFDAQGNAIAVWSQSIGGLWSSIFANRYVSGMGWGTAELLETDDAGATDTHQIAIDPDGNAIAVWHQFDGSIWSIWANHYVLGTGWGTAQLLEADDTGNANYPQIAIDSDGRAISIWRQHTGTAYSIFANRYVSGAGWGTPQLLEIDDTADGSRPQIGLTRMVVPLPSGIRMMTPGIASGLIGLSKRLI